MAAADGGAATRVFLELVPRFLAKQLSSQLDRAAADGLDRIGTFASVCTAWRDAVRVAVGNVAGGLAPQPWVLGTWPLLQRAPWMLQLRFAVRRVRLLQTWSGVQDLRPLCSLVDVSPALDQALVLRPTEEVVAVLAPEHRRANDILCPPMLVINYCTWKLSRTSVLRWLRDLFQFVSAGTVASMDGVWGADSSAVPVEEVEAGAARVRGFVEAVAVGLRLQLPAEAGATHQPALQDHHYQQDVDGMLGLVTALGLQAWKETLLDAAMPLRYARCSGAALASAFREQHGDIVQLSSARGRIYLSNVYNVYAGEHAGMLGLVNHQWTGHGVGVADFDEAARSHVHTAIRRQAQRWLASRTTRELSHEDESREENETQQAQQTELLDDAVLLDIVGSTWSESSAARDQQQLEGLRRLFREHGPRNCYRIWVMTTLPTSLWQSVDTEPASAAAAAPREGLCLVGRHLLGSRWPESSKRKATLTPLTITPDAHSKHVMALQQQSPSTTVGTAACGKLLDMGILAGTPERYRTRAVRALTRDCQRVFLQAADLQKHGLPVVVADPVELGSNGADLSRWRGFIVGPPGTAWEDGKFCFELNVDIELYPEKPPTMQFLPLQQEGGQFSMEES